MKSEVVDKQPSFLTSEGKIDPKVAETINPGITLESKIIELFHGACGVLDIQDAIDLVTAGMDPEAAVRKIIEEKANDSKTH